MLQPDADADFKAQHGDSAGDDHGPSRLDIGTGTVGIVYAGAVHDDRIGVVDDAQLDRAQPSRCTERDTGVDGEQGVLQRFNRSHR